MVLVTAKKYFREFIWILLLMAPLSIEPPLDAIFPFFFLDISTNKDWFPYIIEVVLIIQKNLPKNKQYIIMTNILIKIPPNSTFIIYNIIWNLTKAWSTIQKPKIKCLTKCVITKPNLNCFTFQLDLTHDYLKNLVLPYELLYVHFQH